MSTLSLHTPLVRSAGLVWADVDGDVVLMSLEHDQYFGIGGIGTRIWSLLGEPRTLAEVVRSICEEYDVDQVTCQDDVLRFAQKLFDKDLVLPATLPQDSKASPVVA